MVVTTAATLGFVTRALLKPDTTNANFKKLDTSQEACYPAGQLTGWKYTEACEVLSVEKFITNGVWLACSRRMASDSTILAKPVAFSLEL